MRNEIVINNVVHTFIKDKPKVDCCNQCSLQEICYERFDKFVCSIFFSDKVENGHFEIKK